MHVVVVNHHLSDVIGGSELQCDLVARGLTARGHQVTYVAVAAAAEPSEEFGSSHDYSVVPASQSPRELARAIVDLAPDVVYWRFNRRGVREVARALARAGIPLVFAIAHVDDVRPWPSWPVPPRGASLRDRASDRRSRVRWRLQFRAFSDVAAIASQRTDLIGEVPFDVVARQRHVPNMMDPGAEPFAWPRPFVAWVGNLKPRKRPEMIPLIAEALEPHGVDLVVAGPLQDPRYRWLVEPLAEHPNLHHVGSPRPAQVTGLLAEARCLAVTAMPEGFSNVMIQAWWGGTPTVTLDYDPDGVVEREGLGAVAGGRGPADVERFLAQVVRFAGEGETATEGAAAAGAGARAERFARSRFAPEKVIDALETLLDEVAGPTADGS